MKPEELWQMAVKAREHAYCPYSGFRVGAALLCGDGTVVCGCNIENSAYGPTNCAERTAFFTAVAQGRRSFQAIAIAGGSKEPEICYPCGVCRQVMFEFCDPEEFRVICGKREDELEIIPLGDLLPKGFKMQD